MLKQGKTGEPSPGEERYPARRHFRFLQDLFLNPDSDENDLLQAARSLRPLPDAESPTGDQGIYARIIENLNEENRDLQLKLKLADALVTERSGGNGSGETADLFNQLAREEVTEETEETEDPSTEEVVTVESESDDVAAAEPELPELPPDQGELWLQAIRQQFEEWSLPGQVLGENQPPSLRFREFTEYEVFLEWLAGQEQFLLVTDLEGELLAASDSYLHEVQVALGGEMRHRMLTELFDATAVMMFLNAPADRSFPVVIDRVLLREIVVSRYSVVLQNETVGYLFQLGESS